MKPWSDMNWERLTNLASRKFVMIQMIFWCSFHLAKTRFFSPEQVYNLFLFCGGVYVGGKYGLKLVDKLMVELVKWKKAREG